MDSTPSQPGPVIDLPKLLSTAKPDDMVVVAILSPDGGAVTHTANPDAKRLVNLASSLLDQAGDLLTPAAGYGDLTDDEEHLLSKIVEALSVLPDRFAEDGNDGGEA